MEIRNADMHDLAQIMEIYADARDFMRETGNAEQWGGGYPSEEIVKSDIGAGNLYVCVDGEKIFGVFCYFFGVEPNYINIYKGEWLNREPCGVVHRVAVAKDSHGKRIASTCFEFAFNKCGNLKIDTHRDNIPMQKALLKNGFKRCGVIYLENRDERIAFQKV